MAKLGEAFKFDGCNFFRQRIVLSILSGRSVHFRKMRHRQLNPGISEYERCFLNLVAEVTNGTKININETGTAVYFQPGMLTGGDIEFECNTSRSIGYYLEALVALAPFCREPINATLRGVTSDKYDPSVDMIKSSLLPILKKFTDKESGFDVKIVKRGAAPEGGGEIVFTCPIARQLSNLSLLDQGKVKKIRGVAWAARTSQDAIVRMQDSCLELLRKCIGDVFITKDYRKGPAAGKSPGFGMTLVAETTTGAFYCAEVVSSAKGSDDTPSSPSELGQEAAVALLKEISRGGCVDSCGQSLACLLMALRDRDVSKVKMGSLTEYTVGFLQNMHQFFGVRFQIVEEKNGEVSDQQELLQMGEEKYILKCPGIGYSNLNRIVV